MDQTTNEFAAVDVPDLAIDYKPRLLCMAFSDWATNTADGKGVLGGIFDRIHLDPSQIGQAVPLFIFIKTSMMHEENVIVRIHEPGGKHIGGFLLGVPAEFIAYGPPNSIQIVSPVALVFPVPGVYWFDFWYRGVSVAQVPLTVALKEISVGTNNQPHG